MGESKEEELIRQFNELRRSIEGYFVNRGCTPQEAEDLAQTTFLWAYQGLSKFRGEAGLKTWLFKIAKNVFNRKIRDRKALKRDGKEEPLDDLAAESAQGASNPLDQAVGPEERMGEQLRSLLLSEKVEKIEAAFRSLPPQGRRCLTLYIVQERKYREIAGILGLSINTVKSHIHEARNRLKEQLGGDFDGFGR